MEGPRVLTANALAAAARARVGRPALPGREAAERNAMLRVGLCVVNTTVVLIYPLWVN
jgi:hypothetical protein